MTEQEWRLRKKKGYSQSGTLSTPGNNTPQNSKVSMQAEFPEAGDYTVKFGIIPPKVPVGAVIGGGPVAQDGQVVVPVTVLATVIWKVNGNQVTRKLNVSTQGGTSISGEGEAVEVQLQDATPNNATVPFNTPQQYTATISCAPGTRPVTGLPCTLVAVAKNTVIAGAGTLGPIPIPNDAGVLSLRVYPVSFAGPPPVAPIVRVDISDGFNILRSYNPAIESDFISLPPNAVQIVINNLDPANSISVSADWGIEG
jgi:hypothetical protein